MVVHRLALKHNVKLGVLQHPHNVILTLSCMAVHHQNVHQRLAQPTRERRTSAPLHHVNSLPHIVLDTGYLWPVHYLLLERAGYRIIETKSNW